MGNCLICPPRKATKEEVNESVRSVSAARTNMIFTASSRGDVSKYYDVLRVLGEGSMGSVSLAKKKKNFVGGSAYTQITKKGLFGRIVQIRKRAPLEVIGAADNKLYALKSIILSRVSDEFIDELRNEITILQSLDHPNIVKAYEVYETSVNIYLVLEHCSGGDLYSRTPYSEKDSAKIVGKLLSAITHMHNHNITHRDLKFENIMFESQAEDAEIKLIDFGLSKKIDGGKKYMTEGVGTVYTMAPQVLRGVYNSQADLWSIGVITYMILSNTKPFFGKKRRHVVTRILRGTFTFYSPAWENISLEAKTFVTQLLEVDPKVRLNAEQALAHPWLSKEFALSERAPDSAMMESVHDNIVNYGAVSEFKKMALMVIAHKSTTEEIMVMRKAFDAFDTGNNGTISLEEFKAAMEKADTKYSESDIEDLFRTVDIGADGEIYYLEFLAATLEAHGRITEERLAEAFDRIDSDDSGMISKQNLIDLLGKNYSVGKIDQMLEEANIGSDRGINFDKFRKIFREEQKRQEMELRPAHSVMTGGGSLGSVGSSMDHNNSALDISISDEDF
jgi:calcium-dependent protein kinase